MASAEKEVEKVRGIPFRSAVASALLPEKDLARVLERKLAEDLPVPFEKYAASLVAVGLIDPSPDLKRKITNLYTRQVVGFYDPSEKRFYVVPERATSLALPAEKGAGVDTAALVEESLLAHELTHALQDQRLDLERRMKALTENTDSMLALESLLEGEATVVMAEVLFDRLPAGSRELIGKDLVGELVANLALVGSSAIEGGDGVPDYFVKELVFPYSAGTAWIRKKRSGGGWGAIEEAYRKLPTTTAEILHPDRKGARARLSASDRPNREELPHGARPLYSDTFGEWILGLFLERAGAGEGAAAVAATWQDDRILFFEPKGEALIGFLWRIRCASPADAERLTAALSPLYSGRPRAERPRIHTRGGGDVVEIASGLEGTPTARPGAAGPEGSPRRAGSR